MQGLDHHSLDHQGHHILDHAALEQAHQAQQALEQQGLHGLTGLEHVTQAGLEHQVAWPLCPPFPSREELCTAKPLCVC